MSLEIRCNRCDTYLRSPGGLFFGPPDENDQATKLHLCATCADDVELFIRDPYSFEWAQVEM